MLVSMDLSERCGVYSRLPGRTLFFTIAILATACLAACGLLGGTQPNRNRLALGEGAPAGPIEIEIAAPAEFDFQTRTQVLGLRQQAVGQHPELLGGKYRPSGAVFGQIEDGLPWWGLAGQFYYGPGEQSIEGASEESRFLLNPFLLLAADFYHNWQGRPESEISRRGFVFACPPTQLRWFPDERRGEVNYDADCIRRTNSRTFDLIAYNARDFNLNYVYVWYDESRNIAKRNPPERPYAIPHFLHRGGSCGYPGGCNNMSPPSPEIDALEITDFPAFVLVWLWEEQPDDRSQPPDMVFVVRFL